MSTVENKLYESRTTILALFTLAIGGMAIASIGVQPDCNSKTGDFTYSDSIKKFFLINRLTCVICIGLAIFLIIEDYSGSNGAGILSPFMGGSFIILCVISLVSTFITPISCGTDNKTPVYSPTANTVNIGTVIISIIYMIFSIITLFFARKV